MPRGHRSGPYAAGAAAILLAGIGYEIFRLVVPWPHVSWVHSAVISIFLIVVWGLSVAALLTRRRGDVGGTLAWIASLVAPLAMLMHGLVTRVVSDTFQGVVYVPAALLLVFCLKRTWDGREYRRLRAVHVGA